MEILYRCSGMWLYDDKPMYQEFIVTKRTPNGVYITDIWGKNKKFFYTNRRGWNSDRHVFARPTQKLAYKDYLSRIPVKLLQAQTEVLYWEEEQKRAAQVDWEGTQNKTHVLFLPTPKQAAQTAYAIKMRLAVRHEADLERFSDEESLYYVPKHAVPELARAFVRTGK